MSKPETKVIGKVPEGNKVFLVCMHGVQNAIVFAPSIRKLTHAIEDNRLPHYVAIDLAHTNCIVEISQQEAERLIFYGKAELVDV